MKQIHKLSVLFLLLSCIAFCADSRVRKRRAKKRGQKKATIVKPVKKPVVKKHSIKKQQDCLYKLWISGVECRVCAKAATVALKGLKWLKDPQYHWVEDDYNKSYGAIKHVQQKLNIEAIETALLQQKFNLKAITGNFYGLIKQHANGKWFFKFLSDEREFLIANPKNPAFLLLKRKKTLLKRPLSLIGTIYFDQDGQRFFIS